MAVQRDPADRLLRITAAGKAVGLQGLETACLVEAGGRDRPMLSTLDQKIEKTMDLLLDASDPNISENLETRLAVMEKEKVIRRKN